MISQYHILRLARPEERKDHPGCVCFALNRDKFYPAMLQYIQERLASRSAWPPDASIAQQDRKARALPAEAYKLALAADGPRGLDERQRALRGMALECAREWFTQLLHLRAELKPMVLRLEGGKDRWKL